MAQMVSAQGGRIIFFVLLQHLAGSLKRASEGNSFSLLLASFPLRADADAGFCGGSP
jgi:hypothetical protein